MARIIVWLDHQALTRKKTPHNAGWQLWRCSRELAGAAGAQDLHPGRARAEARIERDGTVEPWRKRKLWREFCQGLNNFLIQLVGLPY